MTNLYEGKPDARQGTANTIDGPFRKRYRALTDDEVALHDRIKDKAAELWVLFGEIKPSREVSLGKTKLEESVTWAIKGLFN